MFMVMMERAFGNSQICELWVTYATRLVTCQMTFYTLSCRHGFHLQEKAS
jgi:hypothetical protein